MKYINTKIQCADLLTKGSFTAVQWKVLCDLAQIGPAFESAKKSPSTVQVKDKKKQKPLPVAQLCSSSSALRVVATNSLFCVYPEPSHGHSK